MYSVDDLFKKLIGLKDLELLSCQEGLRREITIPEAHRPGLALAGFLKEHVKKRILVFGKEEMEYLKQLPLSICKTRLEALFSPTTPAVFCARNHMPSLEMRNLCEKQQIPLFKTPEGTVDFLTRINLLLREAFAPTFTHPGTMVEIFGVGVLLVGESGVGKSQTALGLLKAGHRLVSDDIVKVKKQVDGSLEIFGIENSLYHMEIRGIGIINVANIYGAASVIDKKNLDLVVKLEVWDDNYYYDRLGLEDSSIEMFGATIPYHLFPIKPDRDNVLLIETIALNQRLKKMGFHFARNFKEKLALKRHLNEQAKENSYANGRVAK